MNRKRFLITIIIGLFLSTSCMRTTNKKSANLTQDERAPKNLVSVVDGIDSVLSSMNEVEKTLQLSPKELEIQKEEKQGEGQDKTQDAKTKGDKDKQDESKNQEKTDEGNAEKNNIMTKDEELLKLWKTIDDKVGKIHKDWNSYEGEGMKKGANTEKGKEFKGNLNLLTRAAEERNIGLIMDNGSKTLFSLAYFFDLYKDEIRGDLSRIRYTTYQAYLNAKGQNIANADKLLGSTEEYITRIRQRIDEDKEKMKVLDKLSLSIGDMKQSLITDSNKLLEIKRDIILENTKELQQ